MSAWEQGEVRAEIVQELRALAESGGDVPELADHLQRRLGLQGPTSLLPVLVYFRAAFCLSLREALPLREWLGDGDRSEIDTVLIPAMERTKRQWRPSQLQGV